MGVLNTTPDSFYDGGRYGTSEQVYRRIDELLREGADIVDIGAESTQPQARPVRPDEQWERSQSAICYAVERGLTVSVDTTEPSVAERAIRCGAKIINDVSCLADPDLAGVVSKTDAHLIIMHSRGSMTSMEGFSIYDENAYPDIVRTVVEEWSAARRRALSAGVPEERIWLDPGFGFHKSAKQSGELLRRLSELSELSPRLVVGTSRKSFIGALDDSPAEKRLGGTIASCLLSVQAGASVLRVHDVHDVNQALRTFMAWSPSTSSSPTPGSRAHA